MITSIRLQNFRSYSDESFEFDPAVNIVVGPNASGKTNLLEAILVLSQGGSFRARDIELIRHRTSWARLDGYFSSQPRTAKLELKDGLLYKSFLIDDKPFKRLSLERTVPAVFFEPNHLQLISRGPEQRREYIDGLLERSRTGFKALSASYRRALAQRNVLLKRSPDFGKTQLFAWNVRLSELGAKIAEARQKLVDDINKKLSRTYSAVAQRKSTAKLEYASHFPTDRYASRMLSKLEASAKTDYERGFTAYGPHREDIIFYLNKHPLNQTASRGETRSLMLALKIYELQMLEKVRGHKPLLLLDDVFSELDGKRRHSLVGYLNTHQTIITTTDADAVMEYFGHGPHLIAIN